MESRRLNRAARVAEISTIECDPVEASYRSTLEEIGLQRFRLARDFWFLPEGLPNVTSIDSCQRA